MNKIILNNTDVEKNIGELSGEYPESTVNHFRRADNYQSGLFVEETDSELRQRISETLNLGDF